MKFVRFVGSNGEAGFGTIEGNDVIRVRDGDMFGESRATGAQVSLTQARLAQPCVPTKMLALWNNSRCQIEKLKRQTPAEVLYFLKPASCFITHGDTILFPRGETERVVLEGELGIVVGRPCRKVPVHLARHCIFGYTVINDVTAQDIVQRDPTYPQYVRAKGFDTFGVFGPAIATGIDPMQLRVQSLVNGKLCQDYPVTDLAFDPYQIVADISRTMTLLPGDVIACGTSLGVEPIRPGDSVEIRIDGIGSLVNPVAEA